MYKGADFTSNSDCLCEGSYLEGSREGEELDFSLWTIFFLSLKICAMSLPRCEKCTFLSELRRGKGCAWRGWEDREPRDTRWRHPRWWANCLVHPWLHCSDLPGRDDSTTSLMKLIPQGWQVVSVWGLSGDFGKGARSRGHLRKTRLWVLFLVIFYPSKAREPTFYQFLSLLPVSTLPLSQFPASAGSAASFSCWGVLPQTLGLLIFPMSAAIRQPPKVFLDRFI